MNVVKKDQDSQAKDVHSAVLHCRPSYSHAGGWRIMFGFSAALAVLQLVGMAFMPLSPRWLLSQGRHAEAQAVLLRIRSSQASVRRANDAPHPR